MIATAGLVSLLALAARAAATCADWAGASGALTMTDHGIAGTVTIQGDCTFRVEGFSYDGAAPDVHFLASRPNQTLAELKVNGVVLAPVEKRAYNGECVTGELAPAAVTWDALATVGGGNGKSVMLVAWCNQVKANFGQVVLTKPAAPTTSAALLAPASCCNGWVGASGVLRPLDHGVAGTVTIMADCTFVVKGFSYDGAAPDAHFLVSKGNNSQLAQLKTVGVVLAPLELRAYVGECVTGALLDGMTWDTLADGANEVLLAVWCNQVKADFGDVVLTKPSVASATPAHYTPATCRADCSAWAGASGAIISMEHGVAGNVTLHGDCSFELTGFSYDGVGPDVHFVAVPAGGNFVNGTELGAVPKRKFTNECFAQKSASIAFGDVAAGGDTIWLSVYCELFKANFGHAVLKRPTLPTTNAALQASASCGASACPARLPNCLANCMSLDSYYNAWWEVKDDTITIELEAAVDNTDTWLGFGVADAAKWAMIGADVTIAGFFGGKAQALDYFLSAKMQCNYNSAANAGVCPDDGQKCLGSTVNGTPDVTLLSGVQADGLQRVRFSRKLVSADKCDRSFTNATALVWATGPITQGGARLVVNTHASGNTPGVSGHAPGATYAATRFDFTAPTGIAAACKSAPAKAASATPKPCMPVQLVQGNTSFVATVENFAFYPNPPSWGVSWHMNGVPSPEIVVVRGTKYTFTIKSSASHPFYIVDNAKGGREIANETIFVGNETTFGTAETPFTLEWTPTAATPDLVYYQCYTHQKLGWRIYVIDANATFVLPADSATKCAGATATSTSATTADSAPTSATSTTPGSDTSAMTTTEASKTSVTLSNSPAIRLAAIVAAVAVVVSLL